MPLIGAIFFPVWYLLISSFSCHQSLTGVIPTAFLVFTKSSHFQLWGCWEAPCVSCSGECYPTGAPWGSAATLPLWPLSWAWREGFQRKVARGFPSTYACSPTCLGGNSFPTSPLLPSAEVAQHQTSLFCMDPALDLGPCPASVVLPGVTRTPPTGSAPTPDPHPVTSHPCSLHQGVPQSQPHPQFWSSQMWQGPRMFAQGISGFRGL